MWIIKVFLLVSLMAPFFKRVIRKETNKQILWILISWLFYEILLRAVPYFEENTGVVLSWFLSNVVLYMVPYGIIFWAGCLLTRFNEKQLIAVFFVMIILCFVNGLIMYHQYGHVVATQDYKYPIKLYYVSYAVGMGSFLYFLFSKLKLDIGYLSYIGKNTMWFYLWHIFFVFIYMFIKKISIFMKAGSLLL